MNAPPLLIRPCAVADIPEIAAIYGEAVLHGRASFELCPPHEAEMTERRLTLIEGGYPYLVAEMDRSVAGYAYAGPYRARPAYRSTLENSVYVAPDVQGGGVGRALLTALIQASAERGYRQMIAVIGDTANTASIRLHEAAGFEHVGVLRSVGWKHERWLDTVLMQRELGPGDRLPSDLAQPQ